MDVLEHTPPQNLDAERAVLGAALLDGAMVPAIQDTGLVPESFYRAANATIWRAILHAYQAGGVDVVTVKTQLEGREELDAIGGVDCLMGLWESVGSARNAAYHARLVVDAARKRQIIDAALRIAKQGYEGAEGSADDLARTAWRAVEEATAGPRLSEVARVGEPEAMREILDHCITPPEERTRRNAPVTLAALREAGYAEWEPRFTVVCCRPSIGKSGFGRRIALDLEAGGGDVLVLSLEEGAQEYRRALLAGMAHVDRGGLKMGRLRYDEFEAAEREVRAIEGLRIWLDARSRGVTRLDVVAKARRFAGRVPRMAGLVLDHLGKLQPVKGDRRGYDQVSADSKALADLPGLLDCPVVALVQLNRAAEARDDKRPGLADLRLSGEIEEDARVVLGLYRHSYYHAKDEWAHGIGEAKILKQNDGPAGHTALLGFRQGWWEEAHAGRVEAYKASVDRKGK